MKNISSLKPGQLLTVIRRAELSRFDDNVSDVVDTWISPPDVAMLLEARCLSEEDNQRVENRHGMTVDGLKGPHELTVLYKENVWYFLGDDYLEWDLFFEPVKYSELKR